MEINIGARASGLFQLFSIAILGLVLSTPASASECQNLNLPAQDVIWCDSFEDSDLPASGNVSDNYFDWTSNGSAMSRVTTDSFDGQYALRQRWTAGNTSAGAFFRTFGRSPVDSKSHSNQDFREVYWRMYVKYPSGFQGFPDKHSRIMVFAESSWAQAMIGHVWTDGGGANKLTIDPARGVNTSGVLQTTKWNDFDGLTWMGLRRSNVPLQTGAWQCIEARVALNTPGNSDGKFTLWMDDVQVADRNDLNWVASYDQYGLNAVFISGYWNGGAPANQERYIDSFVIATSRIGCDSGVAAVRPNPPQNLLSN